MKQHLIQLQPDLMWRRRSKTSHEIQLRNPLASLLTIGQFFVASSKARPTLLPFIILKECRWIKSAYTKLNCHQTIVRGFEFTALKYPPSCALSYLRAHTQSLLNQGLQADHKWKTQLHKSHVLPLDFTQSLNQDYMTLSLKF